LLLENAGLPRIRFHDLRHTAASIMLNHGVPVIVVSRRLGHAKPSITLDIYGHLMANAQQEAAQLMDEIVTPIELLTNGTRMAHETANYQGVFQGTPTYRG
jgi:integrase